jgi:NADPH-dependent curcumin reductase CurA
MLERISKGNDMVAMNRVCRLARRVQGPVTRDTFVISDEADVPLADGELRIEAEYISLDPAMRGWINDVRSYVPPVGIGEVMRAYSAGTVVETRNPKFALGDAVTGVLGVQSRPVSDGKRLMRADTALAPLHTWIGGLGMPGLTAYFGVHQVAQLKAGETLVVSAASGAVGQVVGQLAKISGARAVGIAGGPDKCRLLREEFGFDAALDYKAGALEAQLDAACPSGIDVNFENVGGDIFDAVLARMNLFGRVALCGLISGYNATKLPPGPKNVHAILTNRLKVQGFIVFDFIDKYPEALAALGGWYKEGKLKFREDIRGGGIQAFPETLGELYTGGNTGKLVLRVAP